MIKKLLVSLAIVAVSLTASLPIHAQEDLPSLNIVFNPSGTHIKDGYLKVRLDFYPLPESKSYESQHVYVVDESSPEFLAGYKGLLDKDGNPDPIEYQKWLDELPHIWRVNPCLCAFVIVPEAITKDDLGDYVRNTYTSTVTATIDDCMIQPNSSHLISPYMKDKAVMGGTKQLVTSVNRDIGSLTGAEFTLYQQKVIDDPDLTVKEFLSAELCTTINTRLTDFSLGGQAGGTIETVEPKSIDVGAAATDRASNAATSTRVVGTNPANATGTIDTVEIYASETMTDTEVASFYVVSGNNLSTRDSEAIGSVNQGSKQTFGSLSMSINADDYIGTYYSAGRIEKNTLTTGQPYWYVAGDNIPCTNVAFTAVSNGGDMSLYGTGTESGGGWTTISTINSVGEASIGKVNSIEKASIGKFKGITP